MRADESGGGRADGQASGEEVLCGECDPEEPGEEIEARAPNIAKQPYSPTKAEIDSHFPLHAEFRSWCKFCVEGKGASRQHRSGDPSEESIGVTISIDYCFMVPEESEEGMDAVLIAYDDKKMDYGRYQWNPTAQRIHPLSG